MLHIKRKLNLFIKILLLLDLSIKLINPPNYRGAAIAAAAPTKSYRGNPKKQRLNHLTANVGPRNSICVLLCGSRAQRKYDTDFPKFHMARLVRSEAARKSRRNGFYSVGSRFNIHWVDREMAWDRFFIGILVGQVDLLINLTLELSKGNYGFILPLVISDFSQTDMQLLILIWKNHWYLMAVIRLGNQNLT